MHGISKWVSVVVLTSAAWFSGLNTGESGLREATTATVDIETVINVFLDEKGDFEKLNNAVRSKQLALEAIKESVVGMQQEREIYARNDPRFFELTKNIAVETNKLEVEGKALEVWYQTERGTAVKMTYEKALGVIEEYARSKSIAMVQLKTRPELKGSQTFQDVSNAIVVRSVIYADKSIDITEEIQKLMSK